MWGYFRVTPFFSIVKYMSPDGFSGIQILPNSIAAGGAYDAPPDLIVGWGEGHPHYSHPSRRFRSFSLSKIWLEYLLLCLLCLLCCVLSLLRNTHTVSLMRHRTVI